MYDYDPSPLTLAMWYLITRHRAYAKTRLAEHCPGATA
jgi:hypothetical protein